MFFFGGREKNFQNAVVLYSKGNYKQALSVCEKLLKEEPDNCEVLNLMGDAYAHMDKESLAISTYDLLLEKFEKENKTDKAVALTKKIMRTYPDKEIYRERLSGYFGEKGLYHEQISILTALLQEKHRRGYTDEAMRLSKKIADVKTKNIAELVAIVNELRLYGDERDVISVIEKAFNQPNLSGDNLSTLVNTAVETSVETDIYIEYLPDYFAENPDKIEVLKNQLVEYFTKNFNKDYLHKILNCADTALFIPFLTELKSKVTDSDVYEPLLDEASKGNGDFAALLAEIANLPEEKLDSSYAKLCYKYIDHLNSVKLLEFIRMVIHKTHSSDIKLDVFLRLLKAYKAEGYDEMAEVLEDELASINMLIGNEKEADAIEMSTFHQSSDPEINDILELTLMDATSFKTDSQTKNTNVEPFVVRHTYQSPESIQMDRLDIDDITHVATDPRFLSANDDFDDIALFGTVKPIEHNYRNDDLRSNVNVSKIVPLKGENLEAGLLTLDSVDELFEEGINK
jgi:tetratricopeptide (TPR) repeat protein